MTDPRIHVVQVIYSFDLEQRGGGVEQFGIALSQALDPRQFKVSLCGLWQFGTSFEQQRLQELKQTGIHAFTAAPWQEESPTSSLLQAIQGLQAYLANNPSPALHSHSEFGDIAALWLKLSRSAPRIFRTVHYGYRVEWRKRPLRRYLFTHLLYPLLFDGEFGVSQEIVNTLNRRPFARLLRRKAQVLNNAVDLSRFASNTANCRQKRLELGLAPDSFLIGSVGRLTEQKGYTYLIQAAAQVLASQPQVEFILIGDGELMEPHRQLSKQLGIQARFHLLGPRADVTQILPCLDLFASSSLWEGLPTVIMESMACGAPVVATDIPGTRDLVQTGENGWLCPAGNPSALAEALLAAIAAPNLRQQYAAAARETVQRYSITAVAADYARLYLNNIEKK